MRKETHNLELSLRRYTGDIDLNSVKLEELTQLEHQLECSVKKVRVRKVCVYNFHFFLHNFKIHSNNPILVKVFNNIWQNIIGGSNKLTLSCGHADGDLTAADRQSS